MIARPIFRISSSTPNDHHCHCHSLTVCFGATFERQCTSFTFTFTSVQVSPASSAQPLITVFTSLLFSHTLHSSHTLGDPVMSECHLPFPFSFSLSLSPPLFLSHLAANVSAFFRFTFICSCSRRTSDSGRQTVPNTVVHLCSHLFASFHSKSPSPERH